MPYKLYLDKAIVSEKRVNEPIFSSHSQTVAILCAFQLLTSGRIRVVPQLNNLLQHERANLLGKPGKVSLDRAAVTNHPAHACIFSAAL